MSVRAGREFLAVPGPTTIPDEVLQAMQRPAVEIYSKPLIALTDSLLRDLGRLFATEGQCYIYIANGHGAWEAALTNVLSRGDKVLVLESGKFAVDWGNAAGRLGLEVEVLKGDWRHAVREFGGVSMPDPSLVKRARQPHPMIQKGEEKQFQRQFPALRHLHPAKLPIPPDAFLAGAPEPVP